MQSYDSLTNPAQLRAASDIYDQYIEALEEIEDDEELTNIIKSLGIGGNMSRSEISKGLHNLSRKERMSTADEVYAILGAVEAYKKMKKSESDNKETGRRKNKW